MSFTPPPHPNTRPRQAAAEPRGPGDRSPCWPTAPLREAFHADWLAHVEAGRIGKNPAMSEETRAAILANERALRGEGPLPNG